MSQRPGARTGWDTPCEWLRADITRSVQTHVSEESIWNFIQDQPFLSTVERELRQLVGEETSLDASKLKNMDADVDKLKAMFDREIGATWAQAAAHNTVSKLLLGARARVAAPWREYEEVSQRTGNDSTAAYVRRHLSTYAFRHEWLP